jgi:arylsulfatase A-like enzyme
MAPGRIGAITCVAVSADCEYNLVSRSRVVVALLAGLLALSSCSRPEPPNIFLIVIDTLRADRLGAYGNAKGLTPFIDQLAAQGTVFTSAYAPSSWTCPSVASLFTSRYPSQHRVSAFESVLADDETSLAESLQALNYDAAGFSANFRLTAELGYAQGFNRWGAEYRGTKIRGDYLRAQVKGWLEREHPSPALLFLQYMEPHAPYEPPEPYRGRFQIAGDNAAVQAVNDKLRQQMRLINPEIRLLMSLYNGEVASVDAQLQQLFLLLEQQGLLTNAIIVITADHGEEFREHGLMGHGKSLHNETIRIPLIIVAPGYAGGRVVDQNVSLIDIAPTLLELVGLPPEPTFEGRSLVPLLRGPSRVAALFVGEAEPPDVIVELLKHTDQYDLRRHTDGLIRRSTKLLVNPAGQTTAYDLASDPLERKPNPPSLEGARSALLSELQQAKSELSEKANLAAQTKPLDDATKEKLRALGYTHN